MSNRDFFAQFAGAEWPRAYPHLARVKRGRKEILVVAAALRDWLRVVGLDFDYEIGKAQTPFGIYSNVLTLRAGRTTAHFYGQQQDWRSKVLEIDLRGKS
jgi:hypothetical protein